MRDEPIGEAGVEAPRLHERPVACLLDSVAVIVHLVDVTQEPLVRDTAQLVRERRVLLAKQRGGKQVAVVERPVEIEENGLDHRTERAFARSQSKSSSAAP